jgi:hypothetical protein
LAVPKKKQSLTKTGPPPKKRPKLEEVQQEAVSRIAQETSCEHAQRSGIVPDEEEYDFE